MNNKYKVNILILNWNGINVLEECIHSILKSDYSNFLITVIDNGSTDDSLNILNDKFPNIDIIEISQSLGYAKGYNYAFNKIKNLKDDFYLILNNDTVVKKDTISKLVNAMEYYGAGNIYGPKIINQNNKKIWYCGGEINPINGQTFHVGINKIETLTKYKTTETGYVSGCCMLISKETINYLGGFDERFNMYYEDVDLCLRLKDNNKKCYFIAESTIYHKISYSIGGSLSFSKNLTKIISFFKFIYFNNKIFVFTFYLLINLILMPFYLLKYFFRKIYENI